MFVGLQVIKCRIIVIIFIYSFASKEQTDHRYTYIIKIQDIIMIIVLPHTYTHKHTFSFIIYLTTYIIIFLLWCDKHDWAFVFCRSIHFEIYNDNTYKIEFIQNNLYWCMYSENMSNPNYADISFSIRMYMCVGIQYTYIQHILNIVCGG